MEIVSTELKDILSEMKSMIGNQNNMNHPSFTPSELHNLGCDHLEPTDGNYVICIQLNSIITIY